ncbi:MAG: anion permease [Haloarculaceae archaeon]
MPGVTTLATFVLAALASLFMAWAIGAGSSGSTPFAPAVGANAISVMRAGLVVGVLGFLGAVLQGANVTQAVGKELIIGEPLTASAAIVGLLTAAVLVAIGVFAGYPIATSFTVTGAVIGVGLAMGGAPAWAKYAEILTLWTLTPFVGGGMAYLIARLVRGDRFDEDRLIALLGGVVGALIANIRFTFLAPPGQQGSIASTLAPALGLPAAAGFLLITLAVAAVATVVVWTALTSSRETGQRRFLLFLGGLVAFSAGGSQVGLALGPLVPVLDAVAIPLWAILVGGGFGLLVGSWTGAPRMIKAISQDYSSLGPRRSIAALIPSFAIAQTAVAFGIPVSFNEIIVSAIVGSGYAAGNAGVSRGKMIYTVLAWVGSLIGSFLLGYGIYTGVRLVF